MTKFLVVVMIWGRLRLKSGRTSSFFLFLSLAFVFIQKDFFSKNVLTYRSCLQLDYICRSTSSERMIRQRSWWHFSRGYYNRWFPCRLLVATANWINSFLSFGIKFCNCLFLFEWNKFVFFNFQLIWRIFKFGFQKTIVYSVNIF